MGPYRQNVELVDRSSRSRMRTLSIVSGSKSYLYTYGGWRNADDDTKLLINLDDNTRLLINRHLIDIAKQVIELV